MRTGWFSSGSQTVFRKREQIADSRCHRYTHSDVESRKTIGKLFMLYEVPNTEAIDCHRALASYMSDYEDAVMAETAIRSGVDVIVTRNERDYTKAGIRVMSPDEFARVLKL